MNDFRCQWFVRCPLSPLTPLLCSSGTIILIVVKLSLVTWLPGRLGHWVALVAEWKVEEGRSWGPPGRISDCDSLFWSWLHILSGCPLPFSGQISHTVVMPWSDYALPLSDYSPSVLGDPSFPLGSLLVDSGFLLLLLFRYPNIPPLTTLPIPLH